MSIDPITGSMGVSVSFDSGYNDAMLSFVEIRTRFKEAFDCL
jgi:hypothetical protein